MRSFNIWHLWILYIYKNMLPCTDEIFKCKKTFVDTCRQSWLYLDNNGTMTYMTIIQHNMHTSTNNNNKQTMNGPGLPYHYSRPSWEFPVSQRSLENIIHRSQLGTSKAPPSRTPGLDLNLLQLRRATTDWGPWTVIRDDSYTFWTVLSQFRQMVIYWLKLQEVS